MYLYLCYPEYLWLNNKVSRCLEGITMSNPVHTSETRMCGDHVHNPPTAWRAVHRELSCVKSQSCTAFQACEDGDSLLSEGILSFVEYEPRLLIVLPSRQF